MNSERRVFMTPLDVQTCVALAKRRDERPGGALPTGTFTNVSEAGFEYNVFALGPLYAMTVYASFTEHRNGTVIAISTGIIRWWQWFSIALGATFPFLLFSICFGAIQRDSRTEEILLRALFELPALVVTLGGSFLIHRSRRNRCIREDRAGALVRDRFGAEIVNDPAIVRLGKVYSPPTFDVFGISSGSPSERRKSARTAIGVGAIALLVPVAAFITNPVLNFDQVFFTVAFEAFGTGILLAGSAQFLDDEDARRPRRFRLSFGFFALFFIMCLGLLLLRPLLMDGDDIQQGAGPGTPISIGPPE